MYFHSDDLFDFCQIFQYSFGTKLFWNLYRNNYPSLALICCNCCKGYFGFVSSVVKNSQVSCFPGELRQTYYQRTMIDFVAVQPNINFLLLAQREKGAYVFHPFKDALHLQALCKLAYVEFWTQWRKQHCNSHILIWQLGRKHANVQLVGYYCCSFSQGKNFMHVRGWLLYKKMYKLCKQLNFLAVCEKACYFLLYSLSNIHLNRKTWRLNR